MTSVKKNSIILLDNIFYNSIQKNKPPSKYAEKQAMD